MTFNYINLSGTGVEILSAATSDGRTKKLERLLITNTDTTAITVSLYLDDSSDQYYILKLAESDSGFTLDVLDGTPLVYDDTFILKVTLGDAAYVADIIMNEITN